MKIGDEVFVHGYVDEIRSDVVIIRNEGGYFGTVPSEVNCSEKPNNCETCRFDDKYGEESICSGCSRHYSDCYEPKTEPPSGYCNECKWYGDKQVCGRCRSRNLFCEAELQPRCPKCGKRGYIRSLESMGVKLKVFDEYKWKCTNCNKYFKEEPKDEPQTERSACDTCQWYNSGIPCGVEPSVCKRAVEYEPQTERSE